MNVKTNNKFLWQQQSNLLSTHLRSRVTPISPLTSINGVRYIQDVNGESTLRAVQQAIQDSAEFCVISDSINTTDGLTIDSPVSNAHAYFQCMSSGSNGQPKRIRRTQASWVNSFQVTIGNAKLCANDSYAIVGRLSHSLALYAAVEAAWIGADIHLLCDLRPNAQLAALTDLQSSVLYATPTQLRLLCSNAASSTQVNIFVQHIFCGGGKLDQHTLNQLTYHFPNARVKEFYGAAETSFITISDRTTPIDSVGKGYPGVQLQIRALDAEKMLGPNTSQALPVGSVGEIWVKSPYLFEAYASGHEQNTRWHNDYLCIGEMGYIDNNEHLYLTGRRSRMVNIADNMVFPELIEHFFNGLDAVRHCALIPTPDAKRGVVLVAIIEAQGTEKLRQQLLKLSRSEFGALKAPRDIIFVDTLPLLASGKPDLKAIEKRFAKP